MRVAPLICAAVLMSAATAASSATHAVVVGIDNYVHHPRLLGAVNDARDIAAALKPKVDGRFSLLIDAEATRAAFDKAWNETIAAAVAGDMLILSFSGHGVTDTDDKDNPDEEDGLDELLVFQPAQRDVGADQEYLMDDELYLRFTAAEAKGINVLFIADACHAGGLARKVASDDIAEEGLPFRFTQMSTKPPRPAAVPLGFLKKPEISDNVAFVSATTERQRVQEMVFDRQPRGALSYYAARALEGVADRNNDGVLSVAEFRDYVVPMVVSAAGDRQIPDVVARNLDRAIVQTPRRKAEAIVELPDVALFVDDGSHDVSGLAGISAQTDIRNASLVWRSKEAALYNAGGDRLASGVSADRLQLAIDAARVRQGLVEMAAKGAPLAVKLLPDDRLYGASCLVTFSASSDRFRHYTALNLSSAGVVQFLFPLQKLGDPIRWDRADAWRIKSKVSEPFGADYLVFIASERPLVALHAVMNTAGSAITPAAFYSALVSEVGNTSFEIGMKGVYTSREVEPCQG